MNKSYGNKGVSLIECINQNIHKYRIRWDIKSCNNDGTDDTVSFMEEDILHKPLLDEIKSIVREGINKETDNNILSGFIWKDMSVWLSSENQFNYKAAYDLAVQTNGANLPLTFKFGDSENPIYYKFEELEDLQDFYLKALEHINEQLVIGWKKKDSINWEQYKL